MLPAPEPFGPEDFARASGVSRETLARLKAYGGLLQDWNARQNLVSKASLEDMWRRHFWDSAQLLPLIPTQALSLVDLGSGAGFPGLVLAELLRDRTGFRTVLYEATGKKCQFLEAVKDRLGLNVEIRNRRIEGEKSEVFDVVTARALSALPELLPYAQRFWGPATRGLFLKGQNVEGELTQARKFWTVEPVRHESRSDPTGTILEIRELTRGSAKQPTDRTS